MSTPTRAVFQLEPAPRPAPIATRRDPSPPASLLAPVRPLVGPLRSGRSSLAPRWRRASSAWLGPGSCDRFLVFTDDLPFQLEPHAVRLLDPRARDADELQHVGGRGATVVDEPVGVHRRALGAAGARPLEASRLDESP